MKDMTPTPENVNLLDYVYDINAERNTISVKYGDWGTPGRSIEFSLDTLEPINPNSTWDTGERLTAHRAVAEYNVSDAPKRAARIAEIKAAGELVYLRLGELPAGGYSYNYREGHAEAGVSCYRAYRVKGTMYLDCTDGCDPMVMLGGSGATRNWYIISGDECGTGSDGEPVLSNAQVVKKLTRKPTIKVLFPATSAGSLFWRWAE